MRTTVTIDDALYREAKARAARTGQSVGSVIEDALRDLLTSEPGSALDLALPVFSTGTYPDVDYSDTSALMDLTDAGRSVDARH